MTIYTFFLPFVISPTTSSKCIERINYYRDCIVAFYESWVGMRSLTKTLYDTIPNS